MSAIDPLALAGARPRGKRPYFLDDPDTERVLAVIMALAQEVSVLRERLDTVERLLERNSALTRADIDAFRPTTAEAEERGAWTQEFIARILRIVQQEREAVGAADPSSEEVAEELARR